MPNVLIVGASRGLGSELVQQYAQAKHTTVCATRRSSQTEASSSSSSSANIKWIADIDVAQESAGSKLAAAVKPAQSIDILVITAGYFATESLDEPNWENEVKMYTTSAVGPVFIVHHLFKAGLLGKGAKVVIVSSESGSITLRHESEGGGNYAHHASKAASNMVGKLLSLDLKEKGVAVGIVHVSFMESIGGHVGNGNLLMVILMQPGFMRTEMTKGVGFDKFWDDGGGASALKLFVHGGLIDSCS